MTATPHYEGAPAPIGPNTVRVLGHQATAEVLFGSLARADYFATDQTDEFFVFRPDKGDGVTGIFKTWADQVIPVLDTGLLDRDTAVRVWSAEHGRKPLSLLQSLEQWRGYAEVADNRLQRLFEQREVPKQPGAAMVELLGRLKVAFGMGAPFYNLEALIADSREVRTGNPIDFHAEQAQGGRLDAVAMMLPSALQDVLVARKGDWNNLDWRKIHGQVQGMRHEFLSGAKSPRSKQFALVYKIASLAGKDPEDVLFAANALEFIPTDVGGKSSDLARDEALTVLTGLLDRPRGVVSTGLVAKDTNALIRFLNWVPAIRDDQNFKGRFWSYAAACDTSTELFNLVKAHPEEAFGQPFADAFTKYLAPQIETVDASSAKGRFMLQLLGEGRFRPEIVASLAQFEGPLKKWTVSVLDYMRRQESLLDLATTAPTVLVGGKSEGLRKAMRIFGEDAVAAGKVLTTEAVESWLQATPGLLSLVRRLEDSPSVEVKTAIGAEIARRIHDAPVPAELLAAVARAFPSNARLVVRSSSFDEDVSAIGPAPGVYESVVDVANGRDLEPALKEVVSSFFSEKAVAFRELRGLRHKPLFAVIVQELLEGPGGTAFVQNGTITLNVAGSASAVNTLDGSSAQTVEEFAFSQSKVPRLLRSRLLSPAQLADIIWKVQKASELEGDCDLEFAVDTRQARIKLTQMRSLQRPAIPSQTDRRMQNLRTVTVDSLDGLPKLTHNGGVDLHIGPNIDLDSFQGRFLRWIIAHRDNIRAVTVARDIPATSHFANIVETLGIALRTGAKKP